MGQDRYLITREDENLDRRSLSGRAALGFSLGDLAISLDFNLFRYGCDRRPADETYRHPDPVFNRLFLFNGAGGRIEIDGELHEFQPGVIYILAQDHPFVVTYFDRSELLFAHFSLLDHTLRPLFREAPGFQAIDSPAGCEILREAWRRNDTPGILCGIIGALSATVGASVRKMGNGYRLFAKFQPVFEYLSRVPPAMLRVGEMAELMDMTQAAFSRSFTHSLGISPKAYIENIYLARAKELLLFSSKSVDEIAGELGHEHRHYFHTVFPRLTGMAPGEFRRNDTSRS